MTLDSLKKSYLDGSISKPEYIKEMHMIHRYLFEYSEFIKETDIEKIEIISNQVIMTTRTTNIKILCDKDDFRLIPLEILNFGAYEENELKMILRLIDKNAHVFDVGANIGWVSMNISKKIKNVEIFAFEPIPKTFGYLNANISLNGLSNIKTYNFGLSDEEKELEFFYYPEGSGNASSVNLSESSNVQKIICSVKRLDDFAAQNNLSVDFIKCDVEGAELFVFQGGMEVLKKDKPVVFTEMLRKWSAKFNYHPNQIISIFKDLGYGCFILHGERLKEFFAMDENTVETNFFFLHREKHHGQLQKLLLL